MKPRKAELEVNNARELRPIRIISDAAVTVAGRAGGRMIPFLVLDTSDRPDVEEAIRVHQKFDAGDVRLQWCQLDGHDGTVALLLKFIRPSELTLLLEFDIVSQGILVDQVLRAQGLYIQAGRNGDRLTTDPNRPKVLLEVGELGFGEYWNTLYHRHLEKQFRTRGLSRAESRQAARRTIIEMRKFLGFRLSDSSRFDS